MKNRLIILVTKSDNDWAKLREKKGFPRGSDIAYLECEKGILVSSDPIECERLLCIITLKAKDKNTENLCNVLSQYKNYDVAVGAHIGQEQPENIFEVSNFPNNRIEGYTTTGELEFIPEWCNELATETPDSRKIIAGFDKLWMWFDIPYRLEAYLDIMLNLATDNCLEDKTMRKYTSEIMKAASNLEKETWTKINRKIENWNIEERDAKIEAFNRKFFRFAEKELINRYPYFSDLE